MFKKKIDKTPQSGESDHADTLSMQAQNITKSETKFALARTPRVPELNKAMSLIRKQPLTP